MSRYCYGGNPGLCRKRTVRFKLSAAAKVGMHPDTAKRGLRAREAAQLVKVSHHPGQSLEVTLLDTLSDP